MTIPINRKRLYTVYIVLSFTLVIIASIAKRMCSRSRAEKEAMSFNKAHKTIAAKYNFNQTDAEWGGIYNRKYDGMHFGLTTAFMKFLTNKKE